MREIRTSGLMSGERKRSDAHRAQATAPLLDSTRMPSPVTKNRWRAVDPLPKSGLVYLSFSCYDPRNYGVSSMVSTPEQTMAVWGMGDYLDVDEKIVYRPTKRGYLLGFKGASAWRF